VEVDRQPCPSCGRCFAQPALQQHVRICDKVFGQKRKVRTGCCTSAFCSCAGGLTLMPLQECVQQNAHFIMGRMRDMQLTAARHNHHGNKDQCSRHHDGSGNGCHLLNMRQLSIRQSMNQQS
jgi:hypothetical protein